MKKILGTLLILIVFISVFLCAIPNTVEADDVFHATADMLQGKSYAVLTTSGELIFFRSNATYEYQSTGTFTDIKGNTYQGTIYCGDHRISGGANDGFEHLSGALYYPFPSNMRTKVLSARVAEGQAIKPESYMIHMFYGFSNCTSIDLTGFDTENITFWNGCFQGCKSLINLNYSGIDFSKARSFTDLFNGCASLTSLDFHHATFQEVKNASNMFYNCSSLTNIIFANEKVFASNMYYNSMFRMCSSLKQLNLSSFDTSEAVNMSYMFEHCNELVELDLSNFNTDNVKSMESMFGRCFKLKSLNVSSFNTKNVTKMNCMFELCESLQELDISNFRAPKVQNTESMFKGCASLTELDLSNFNTSEQLTNASYMFGSTTVGGYNGAPNRFLKCAVKHLDISGMNLRGLSQGTYSLWDTYNPAVVESIVMGENSTPKTKYMVFPKPPASKDGVNYTGKWIRDDKSYGPYTPAELVENYDGTTMKGTWVWEKASYTVSYSYTGMVPGEASKLPANSNYEQGTTVVVEKDATAPGYTFSGWSRTGTFEMPAENIEITGSFTRNTDTPYKVEHYLEDLTEGTYTLTKTDNLTGTTDTEAQANAKDYEGFTFDNTIDGTIQSGTIAGDGSLVLKLYYKRNSYNVTYAYTGDVPDGASQLPQAETYKYGAEIIVPVDAKADGYTFSGWIKDYITMPAQDIEIRGSFIEIPKSYNYKVEYYFDGIIDDALNTILNAEKDEEINLTPQTPLKHGEKNYTLVSNNHKITISVNDNDNVIRVYYETDVLDYAIDNFEDTTEGDGIPDKYQIRITYKVQNGSWNDGTNINKVDVITLYDKDGNTSEDGSGSTKIPEVGGKPNQGYTYGYWNKNIPSKVTKNDNGKEYVYSYETIKTIETDIAGGKGKASNPKTDDVMNRYLLAGVGGILVLMLVSRIRIRYSRKAKKIQF